MSAIGWETPREGRPAPERVSVARGDWCCQSFQRQRQSCGCSGEKIPTCGDEEAGIAQRPWSSALMWTWALRERASCTLQVGDCYYCCCRAPAPEFPLFSATTAAETQRWEWQRRWAHRAPRGFWPPGMPSKSLRTLSPGTWRAIWLAQAGN